MAAAISSEEGRKMDVDELMQQFRLASREIFNHYFRIADPYKNNGWALESRFKDVQELLFQKLVAEPTSLSHVKYGDVQPNIGVELSVGDSAPIQLNRESDSGYWDHPIDEVQKGVRLNFISFFDWDQLNYRDNRYVRAYVADWPGHPELIGKNALIESHYVLFVTL
jgi:hypothetical protein